MSTDADVRIGADLSSFDAALNVATNKLRSWGRNIAALGAGIAGAGLTLAGPILGAALAFTEAGSRLNDMSDRTGVSVEALSQLGFAAGLSGASIDDLEGGLRKMSRFVAEAASGSIEATKKLEELGITIDQLNGLTQDKRFELFADKIAAINDPAQRVAAAMAVFGRGGTALLPMIADGAEGLRRMREEADRLGITMSTEDAQAADRFGDSLDTVKATLAAMRNQIGAAVLPVLQAMATSAIEIVGAVNRWVSENRALFRWLLAIGGILFSVGSAIGILGGGMIAVAGIIVAVKAAFAAVAAALIPIAVVIGVVISAFAMLGLAALAVYTAMSAMNITWADVVAFGGQAARNLIAYFRPVIDFFGSLWQTIRQTGQGVWDALSAGNLQLGWDILVAGLRVLWLDFKFFFISNFGQIVDAALSLMDMISGVFQVHIQVLRTAINALVATYNGIATAAGAVGSAGTRFTQANNDAATGLLNMQLSPLRRLGLVGEVQSPDLSGAGDTNERIKLPPGQASTLANDAQSQMAAARANLAALTGRAAREAQEVANRRPNGLGPTDLDIQRDFDSAGAFGGAGLAGFGVQSRMDSLIDQSSRQVTLLDEIRLALVENPGDPSA